MNSLDRPSPRGAQPDNHACALVAASANASVDACDPDRVRCGSFRKAGLVDSVGTGVDDSLADEATEEGRGVSDGEGRGVATPKDRREGSYVIAGGAGTVVIVDSEPSVCV